MKNKVELTAKEMEEIREGVEQFASEVDEIAEKWELSREKTIEAMIWEGGEGSFYDEYIKDVYAEVAERIGMDWENAWEKHSESEIDAVINAVEEYAWKCFREAGLTEETPKL